MKVLNFEQTCYGCPTVFEWDNKKGDHFYFRLRHGYAYIQNETSNTVVIKGNFPNADGICSWSEVKDWALSKNLKLINL